MYSPDQIEQKRQAALEKQRSRKQQMSTQIPRPSPVNKPSFCSQLSSSEPQKRKNNDTVELSSPKFSKSLSFPSNNQFNKSKYSSGMAGQTLLTQNNYFKTNSPSNDEKKNNSVEQKPQIKSTDPGTFYNHIQTIQGTCYLISESRFEINVPFYQPLIDLFKHYSSRSYNLQTKLWNFNLTEYHKLMADVKATVTNVSLVGIPKFVMRTFLNKQNKEYDDTPIDLSPIDSELRNTLMPFQKDGICYGIKKNGRCIIADDMGLGKTIQALGIASYYRNDWPLLIVTPSSVRYQWSEAIYKYLPSVPVQQVQHFTRCKDYLENVQITIVSYDLLTRSIEMFASRVFPTIIVDESHALKNYKTSKTKAVHRLSLDAKHILLLSGTPALSRPIELYSQLTFVTSPFMRLQEYGIRYCAAVKRSFGMDYTGSSNIGELQLLLKALCVLRRLKTEVLKQLPEKIREVVILDKELIAKKSKAVKELDHKLQSKTCNQYTTIIEYFNESSEQRLPAVCNYIEDLLDNKQKFIVFAHHLPVLDGICEVLDKKKVKYIRIDGSVKADNRKHKIDLFQNSDSMMVAVLSITAANSGITLTAANFVVFAELYWNPSILIQAEDRAHRIGQDHGVVIRYLVGKNTVDDYLWPMIQSKTQFLASAGLNIDFSLNDARVMEQNQNQIHIDKYLTTSNNINSTNNGTYDEEIAGVSELFDNEEDW